MSARKFVKSITLAGLAVLALSGEAKANLSIEGHYQGVNVIVQSPESEDGFGYCVSRVLVNGNISSASCQSSAFQVDLTEFDINVGDPVLIVVEHEEGCKPKLINPEVLLPKSTYILDDISCTPDGLLSWSTTGESGKLAYQVEQYKWNKWIVIGEVDGNGSSKKNTYTFIVSPHSGENKIRISQTDMTGEKRASKEVTFTCIECPEPIIVKEDGGIVFQNNGKPVKTKYEIYDAYGNIVKKGMNSAVDCGNLKKGVYHVNFDNKYEKFFNQ
jgi:hypothetical protein